MLYVNRIFYWQKLNKKLKKKKLQIEMRKSDIIARYDTTKTRNKETKNKTVNSAHEQHNGRRIGKIRRCKRGNSKSNCGCFTHVRKWHWHKVICTIHNNEYFYVYTNTQFGFCFVFFGFVVIFFEHKVDADAGFILFYFYFFY